jgi:hypothetical protein
MDDIVACALDQREDTPGHGQVTWRITFTNNESRVGTIGMLGNGNYALMSSIHKGRVYFFNADKVVYMHQEGK